MDIITLAFLIFVILGIIAFIIYCIYSIWFLIDIIIQYGFHTFWNYVISDENAFFYYLFLLAASIAVIISLISKIMKIIGRIKGKIDNENDDENKPFRYKKRNLGQIRATFKTFVGKIKLKFNKREKSAYMRIQKTKKNIKSCPYCGAIFFSDGSMSCCPICRVTLKINNSTFKVTGTNADDVRKIVDNLYDKTKENGMTHIIKLPSVFISYSWKQSDFADELESNLNDIATVIRDKNDIAIGDSLTAFMKRIRKEDFAVLLISDEYLKSINCMFEVSQLVKDETWKEKVIFVVFNNAKIYSVSEHGIYIDYWQEKRQVIERQIDISPKQSSDGLVDELRKIDEIQIVISSFLMKVRDLKNPQMGDAVKTIIERIINIKKY